MKVHLILLRICNRLTQNVVLDGYIYVIIVNSNTTGCPLSKKEKVHLLVLNTFYASI
jgi:hypothetical protein